MNGYLAAYLTKPNLALCVVSMFVYPCATHRSGSCPSQLLQVMPLDGSTAHHRLFGSSASSGSQRIKHKDQRPNVVMANLAHFGRLVAVFVCSLLQSFLHTHICCILLTLSDLLDILVNVINVWIVSPPTLCHFHYHHIAFGYSFIH